MTPLLSDSLRDCIKTIMEKHDSRIATDLYTADKYIETIRAIKKNSWTIGEENYQFLKDSIQKLIDGLITDEVRALSIRKDVFEIAFTPKGKDLVYTDTNTWRENRQTGKPGRIIRKLLAFDYKERDIEIFNNLLKSEIMSTGDFDIVSGSDICHWYNQNNYFKIAGTLGNSCMKYESCSCYFRIYEDCAKLLICTKGDKLLGRAILWEIDGQTYMDRVYTCMDYLEEQFYQYAMDQGWTIRDNNGLLHDGDNMYWQEAKSSYKTGNELHLSIKLPELYDQFPYMIMFHCQIQMDIGKRKKYSHAIAVEHNIEVKIMMMCVIKYIGQIILNVIIVTIVVSIIVGYQIIFQMILKFMTYIRLVELKKFQNLK